MNVSPSALLAHARSEEGRKQLRYVGVSVVFVPLGQILVQILGAVFDGNFTKASIVASAILTIPNFFANRHFVWRVENRDNITLTAPAETGLYEIRYVLDEGSKTLASSPLEVVAADAPLDDGAGLSAPASATPGETITVSWTISPDDADRRVALAKAGMSFAALGFIDRPIYRQLQAARLKSMKRNPAKRSQTCLKPLAIIFWQDLLNGTSVESTGIQETGSMD